MAEAKETQPDVKPVIKSEAKRASGSKHVKLVLSGMDGRKVTVKIKRDVPLGEAMKLFAETFNLPLQDLRFFYDDTRISSVTTPSELNIEDEEHDTIDVFWKQEAGH